MLNPYIPVPVEVADITIETEDKLLKTFKLTFCNKEDEERFQHTPGQFAELSLLGKGESPIGIASSPTEKGFLLFTVMKVGVVTTALHNLNKGARMGIRGPLGNFYPIKEMEGKNVVVIGGGFAFTTLRALINYMIYQDNRSRFGDITVIYGARTPGMLIYKEELARWDKRDDLNLHITVDRGDAQWKGKVGFVPAITKEVAPSSKNAYAVVCGPPIMIKFTLPTLQELGFPPERIITSLEMRMKCGIGKCGRCNIGYKYVCIDGPVFTFEELSKLPKEY
ncbi:MAG: FAD/NAD(P)-binding protein [Nitrospirota bacterium]